MRYFSTLLLKSCSALFFLLTAYLPLSGQTVIGGSTPDPSSILDIQSDSKGMLFPRMTTEQRDLITNAATGLMIFNTNTNCLEINLGIAAAPSWQTIKCGVTISTLNCTTSIRKGEMQPNFQADGVSVLVPYTGGDGSAHSGQIVNSTGVTGYTATLAAGNFVSGDGTLTYIITGTSATPGTATFALNIGGQTCDLDLSVRSCSAKVNATDTKIFHCYNLGAYNTRVDAFTPSYEIIGHYYQWGRKPDCFGIDGADAPNPCTSPIYGAAGPWGSTTDEDNAGDITGWVNNDYALNTDWTDPSNAKGSKDPCPQGFRIPSRFQWEGVIANNSPPIDVVNAGGAWLDSPTNYDTGKKFGNDLFLPAAGVRKFDTGSIFLRGSLGSYWSSTVSGSDNGWHLYFDSGNIGTNDFSQSHGLSLRCIAEEPD